MNAWEKPVFNGAAGLTLNARCVETVVFGVSRRGRSGGLARSLTPHFTTTASFPELYVDVHLFVAWNQRTHWVRLALLYRIHYAATRAMRTADICHASLRSCLGERLPD